MNLNFKNLLPHIAAIVIFLLTSIIYFLPQLQGKTLRQTDIIQYKAMSSEISDYEKKGEVILWTNSQFSGMPSYQIHTPQKYNVSNYLEKITQLFLKRPIGYFIGGMIAFYISLILLGANPWLAIVGGIAFAFTTNNLVLYEAGHTSKVRVLMISVMIVAGMISVFRKDYLKGGLAFAIGMAISIYGNHFQMTYYLGILLGLYALIESIYFIKNKDFNSLLKAGAVLLFGVIIAIGASASKIWTTLEYSKETMRGKPILEKINENSAAKSSSETDGLEWTYSMNWSNGILDAVAMYIPGVAGGGSSEPLSKDSATNKFMKKNRQNTIPYGPMYWGKLPFTSGPQYIGAISFLLFFLSLFFLNGRLRWWAASALLITIFMSMGKNFEAFNRIFFDYFPMFNKFRSPSSVTSITAIIVPFIAFLGLHQIFTNTKTEADKNKFIRILLIVTGSLAAFCLFFAFIGPSVFSFETAGDARYAQTPGLIDVFLADRASLMRSDALRTLILTLLSAATLYFWAKNKLKQGVVALILGVLVIFDLWGVDKRYLNNDSFQNQRTINAQFEERQVDKQIKQDSDLHYRVHDITPAGGPYNSSSASYHHKTIGGYHAAKLQRYQDLIDTYLIQGNQPVLNMLNAKYFIVGKPGEEEVKQNPGALGNAWFVDEIVTASTNREELDKIGTIDPSKTAIVHQEFDNVLKNQLPNGSKKEGTISLNSYNPDKLTYNSDNGADGLAVFSEIWYGKDGDWKMYIDGKEASLIRANYILRAGVIPAGKHEIILEFKPKSYYTGELISLVCSILLMLSLAYFGYIQYNKSKKTTT